MQENIDISVIPSNYPICFNRECSKAVTCLRQIAEQNTPDEKERLIIISPKYLSTLKGACPHYRSSKKVRYAKGFIKILDNLPYTQMRKVISKLTTYFGRTHYYRVRKGERLLSPAEQQGVLNILKNCGATGLQEFDKYIEEYNW